MLKSHVIGQGVADPFGCSNFVLASANLLKRRCAHEELCMQSPRGSNRDPRERNTLLQRQMRRALSRVHRMGTMALCVRMHTSPWWLKI